MSLQIRDLELELKVRFLLFNTKQALTDHEFNLIIPDYLNSGLYLPDYSFQGVANGKDYDCLMKGLSSFTSIHQIILSGDYGQP